MIGMSCDRGLYNDTWQFVVLSGEKKCMCVIKSLPFECDHVLVAASWLSTCLPCVAASWLSTCLFVLLGPACW